jgi:hypothetical protein
VLGYEVAKRTSPVYQATINLIVGDETSFSRIELHDVQASVSLAGMYGALIRSQAVLERVVHQLGLGVPWQTLKDRVHVDTGQNDPIIRIGVLASSGPQARALATAVAKRTVTLSPEGVKGPSLTETHNFLVGQVAVLESHIAGIDEEISRLQGATRPSERRRLQSRIQLVSDWQSSYIALSHLLSSGGSPNTLRVLGDASATAKIHPFTKIDTTIGGGLGLLAGVTLVQAFVVKRRRKATEGSDSPTEREWHDDKTISIPRGARKPVPDPWIPELIRLSTRPVRSTRDSAA